jgi:hypothetical protein
VLSWALMMALARRAAALGVVVENLTGDEASARGLHRRKSRAQRFSALRSTNERFVTCRRSAICLNPSLKITPSTNWP